MNTSWHWIFWILTIVRLFPLSLWTWKPEVLTSVLPIQFSFVMLFSGALNPETYAPVLLRRRAAALQAETGKVYRSMYDLHPMFAAPFAVKMKAALLRPFLLLIKEPICSLFALYTACVYGMLYCFFGAFPLVFEYARGWSPGISGLAFIPVGLGMVGVSNSPPPTNTWPCPDALLNRPSSRTSLTTSVTSANSSLAAAFPSPRKSVSRSAASPASSFPSASSRSRGLPSRTSTGSPR